MSSWQARIIRSHETRSVECDLHSDHLGRFHLTSDVWCLPPLDLLWRKQCLYVRHWIIQKRQVMMPAKCTLQIGCFSSPKDCCFLFWCGTRQAYSNRNTARPFLKKKENFDYVLFSESGSLSANVIRFRWPHHKMYRRNYISITVIHPRLEAACRNQPKLSECSRHARRLNHFHTSCLCRIRHKQWQDKIPDTEVLQKANLSPFSRYIRRAGLVM